MGLVFHAGAQRSKRRNYGRKLAAWSARGGGGGGNLDSRVVDVEIAKDLLDRHQDPEVV